MKPIERTDFERGIEVKMIDGFPRQTKGCVYMIKCPLSNQPIYVGQSIGFSTRCANHLSKKKKKLKLDAWIQETKSKGLRPLFEVIELVDLDSLDEVESLYIQLFKSWGFNLFNGRVNTYKIKKDQNITAFEIVNLITANL